MRGMMTSVYMIGTWMLCYFPVIFVFVFFVSFFLVVGDGFSGLAAMVLSFFATALRVVADTLGALIITAGMAHGIREIFEEQKKTE